MNELRETKIRYREPLAFPRADIGPTNTVLAPPLELQNSITPHDMQSLADHKLFSKRPKMLSKIIVGEGSTNVLGDDYGLARDTSAKGLPRPDDSPFEPTILKPTPMERLRPLTGAQLDQRQFRRIFDSERYPEHFNSHIAMSGGMTLSRRNALKTLAYPLGMA
jgi:hypothetical protein